MSPAACTRPRGPAVTPPEPPPPEAPPARWQRRTSVLWRHTLGGVVALAPTPADPCLLRGEAGKVWDLLATAGTADELEEAGGHDLGPVLDHLLELGMVEPAP